MFTLRALNRLRKCAATRKVRGSLEMLETRKLMAGDVNMGSYVIGASSPDSPAPPALVRSPQVASVNATVTPSIVDSMDPLTVDAALTFDQPAIPQNFLPCCPAVPSDSLLADASFVEDGDADATLNEPVKPVAPPQALGWFTGPNGSRDRTGAGSKTTYDNRLMHPLSVAAIQSDNLLTVSGAREVATQDSTMGDEFRYFTADGNRPSSDGPSLANQSLSPYVQSDTFMAMGLLPSPMTTDQHDDPAFATQSESHSSPTQSVQFDTWLEREDLNSLREEASAIDADLVVDPLPLLGAITNPISAAMTSFVGIDFYDVDSDSSENSSLITKINRNRVQFAAFAFVFTVVTVRMNSADSKRDKQKLDSARDQKPIETR